MAYVLFFTQKFIFEIVAFCTWELTSTVYLLSVLQVLNNTVVAFHSAVCLDLGYKACVFVLEFVGFWNLYNSLEKYRTLIPTWFLFV